MATAGGTRGGAQAGVRLALILVVAVSVLATGCTPTPSPSPSSLPTASPGAARPSSAPSVPLLVSLDATGGQEAHVGFGRSVTVHALGMEPIAGVELWVDGRLLGSAASEGGGPAQVARWTWTPPTAGPVVLVARATDTLGREAQSAPLRLQVLAEPPVVTPFRRVLAEAGETARDVAGRAGGLAPALATWNPTLDLDAPLDAGIAVVVPLAAVAVPADPAPRELEPVAGVLGGPAVADVTPAGTAELASWSGGGPVVTASPAAGPGLFVAPEMTVDAEDCTLTVAIQSSDPAADGVAVHALGPAATAFAEVATLGADGGPSTWSSPVSAGAYLVSAATFGGGVVDQGPMIKVDVTGDCGAGAWSGTARFDGTRLAGGVAVDRAYVYLSVDDGPWRRVPGDPSAFVEVTDGVLDFGPWLPADLALHRADIEAWGWSGTGLLALGTGHQEPAAPTSSPPPPLAGGATGSGWAGGTFVDLDLVTTSFEGGSSEFEEVEKLSREADLVVWDLAGGVLQPLAGHFRWQTNGTAVDRVVWQVSAFPLPAGLAPEAPGVLLQQTQSFDPAGVAGGDIDLDLRPIFVPDPLSANVGDQPSEVLAGQLQLGTLPASGAPSPAPAPAQPGPSAGASPGGTTVGPGQLSPVATPSWLLAGLVPSTLYVRAIPMAGSTPVGVSNDVRLKVTAQDPAPFEAGSPPSTGSPGLKPYQLFLQLMPPANANPAFANCVMVTGFAQGIQSGAWGLQPGDFMCLKPSSGGGGWTLAGAFEDFVDFVADSWDAVAGAWSWIQDQLVTAVANYSGCSALAGGSFCQGLAKVALSTALAAAGIPPSLPTTDELIAMGKGELGDALVDMARKAAVSATGVDPCSAAELAKAGLGTDGCGDIAQQLIEDLADRLDELRSKEAAAITGVWVPYGVNVAPHPWGQLRPPRLSLTIARNVAVPLPAGSCRMTLSMSAEVASWTHQAWDPDAGQWTTRTGPVGGAPFAAISLPVPNPETAEGPVVELSPNLPPDASIYQVMLAALKQQLVIGRRYYLTEPAFWREPGNPTQIYQPGKGYLSVLDQTNHAWVLLQHGTPVKAMVTRTPGSPDCFDTVSASGAIPTTDLGQGCYPVYSLDPWELDQALGAADPTHQAACVAEYQEVAGW